MEKRETSYTIGGNVTGTAIMENSMKVPQRTKNNAATMENSMEFP